jgi:hypothetical protein
MNKVLLSRNILKTLRTYKKLNTLAMPNMTVFKVMRHGCLSRHSCCATRASTQQETSSEAVYGPRRIVTEAVVRLF